MSFIDNHIASLIAYLWFARGFVQHSFNSLFDCFRGNVLHRS